MKQAVRCCKHVTPTSAFEPPLIIVSPYWQLSDAKRYFDKDFSALEV